MSSAEFEFAGQLRLRVTGDAATIGHARREYGPAEVPYAGPVDLQVDLGQIGKGAARATAGDPAPVPGSGGHKTVRWRVILGDPASTALVARIETSGWPGSFARSLAQGYILEPLLSVAAARRGIVLLPGAGIVLDDGLVLLLGRSRAGKSTLAARALTAGRDVLGDDQLFVGSDGSAWPFPRSLRFYPDLVRTAPAAYAGLRRQTRLGLRLRAVLARLSVGYVRPSLAIDGAGLGLRWNPEARPIARLVLIERDAAQSDLDVASGSTEQAVEWGAELLRDQRSRLAILGGEAWRGAIERAAAADRDVLGQCFEGLPVDRLSIPGSWDAPTAIAATSRWLGIEPPGESRR